MMARAEAAVTPLAVIGVDIGKEVFHLVGFGADGKIAFRRRIRRLALRDDLDGHDGALPASHFFEFTGTKSPKTKWKFTKVGEDWFCFAGLWRPMPQGGEAFTLLTTEPGADVAPIDDRQMVILKRSNWSAWLEQTGNEAALLCALPASSLRVEQVR